ncbi:MAG: hypothetical protein A3C47_06300 [Omnitrophica bacterium RIFCSPHIGHO2_02_FULL_51_18]|nr:MAG: hypothetical protein A3C47_06300 [Omnitrophica bacterium RIFCSPHIGHO2_02_FULL_51_18]
MRYFIDTSSLFKKYIDEHGSDEFGELVSKASEIAVSPIAWIEMNAAIAKALRRKLLTSENAQRLQSEMRRDFSFFSVLAWNENLENKTVEIIFQHALKTMDAIQLASGFLSDSGIFVTSDRQLYRAAKKTLRHVRFV